MKTNTKLLVFFLFSFFYSLNSNAQVVSGMNYQAVIRNSSNALIANTVVGVKISILEGSATGTVIFSERHTPTTNANGLATFVIGEGTPIISDFFAINWLAGLHFIKTETDPTGGTNYTITNTSQLNTVPYSQFAENSLYASYSGDSWKKNGNVVDLNTDFIGSTNDVDVVFKRNNIKAGAISKNDNISFGVGTFPNINSSASNNSAFGARALNSNISGFNNTAVGTNALLSNNGDFNTAVGVGSSFAITDGDSNTSMGHFSLKTNSTGSFNTAIGKQSLEIATGDQNTAIGWSSLGNLTTGGGNIAIGKLANVPTATANNQLSIGNVIYGTNMGTTATGTIGIGVPVPTERLEVDGKTKTTNLQVTAGAGINKVLTSDAGGNATWQTSNANTGIHIEKTVGQAIPALTDTKIIFSSELTDDANAFSNSEWTIPSTGFYHIYSTVSGIVSASAVVEMLIVKNGNSIKWNRQIATGNSENYEVSADLKLIAGDIISIYFFYNTGTGSIYGVNVQSYFSGFKIY